MGPQALEILYFNSTVILSISKLVHRDSYKKILIICYLLDSVLQLLVLVIISVLKTEILVTNHYWMEKLLLNYNREDKNALKMKLIYYFKEEYHYFCHQILFTFPMTKVNKIRVEK